MFAIPTLLLLSCREEDNASTLARAAVSKATDEDGDGHPAGDGLDCEDLDASVHPGAAEDCDGVDQDCDGVIDGSCRGGEWGEVDVSALPVGLADGCGDGLIGAPFALADVDGDGRADVVGSTGACPEPSLAVIRGPVPSGADLAGPDDWLAYGGDFAGFDAGPDVTGDGMDDWLIVSGDSTTGNVSARLHAGPLTGEETAGDALLTVTVGAPAADTTSAGLPRAFLAGGGDGAVVLLATYERGDQSVAPSLAQASHLLDASTRGEVTTEAIASFTHEGVALRSVATRWARPGDLDGDGEEDLVRSFGRGLHVYLSPLDPAGGDVEADAVLGEALVVTLPPLAVRRPGDADGDGLADLAVPAFDTTERRYGLLRLGADGAGSVVLDEATPLVAAEITGVPTTAWMDADGDDASDLAVGAPAAPGGGAAWIFRGPLPTMREVGGADLSLVCSRTQCGLGHTLATGDTNGDGFDDLLVGGQPETAGAPFAWTWFGGVP